MLLSGFSALPGIVSGMGVENVAAAEKPLLLVVDDEQTIAELVAASLRHAGYRTLIASNGLAALSMVRQHQPDGLILDVMMPGMDGWELVERLRAQGDNIPTLMLTAKDSSEDQVRGLSSGADDYVVKPFKLEVLLARVQAVLRRAGISASQQHHGEILQAADLRVDIEAHIVTKAGVEVELTPTEFKLLVLFMRNEGMALTKTMILDQVWNYGFDGESNIVESYVSYLRRKIDTEEPRLIQTVRGVGYRFRDPMQPSTATPQKPQV